jgi:hypothetical protein
MWRGLCLALLFVVPAAAFDSTQWGHDTATGEWFRSLHNKNGTSCCDTADGVRLEDPEWRENQDGTYEVFVHDKWHMIEPDHVLTGSNRVGYAIVWWPMGMSKPTCFLPGGRT